MLARVGLRWSGVASSMECLKYLYLQNLEADLQNAKGKKKKKST